MYDYVCLNFSPWTDLQPKAAQHTIRQDRKDVGAGMVRSQSQDADISLAGTEVSYSSYVCFGEYIFYLNFGKVTIS